MCFSRGSSIINWRLAFQAGEFPAYDWRSQQERPSFNKVRIVVCEFDQFSVPHQNCLLSTDARSDRVLASFNLSDLGVRDSFLLCHICLILACHTSGDSNITYQGVPLEMGGNWEHDISFYFINFPKHIPLVGQYKSQLQAARFHPWRYFC
jgi:hypothetical protein